METKPLLLLRFSSLGDVAQALGVAAFLHQQGFQVHFAVRSDFQELVKVCPFVKKVWVVNRSEGLRGTWRLAQALAQEPWTHVYDLHRSLRSTFILWFLRFHFFWTLRKPKFLHHKLYRFRRWIWIRFKKNWIPGPRGAQAQMFEVLKEWGFSKPQVSSPWVNLPEGQLREMRALLDRYGVPNFFIALAPSAAHPLKRWPIEFWQELIQLMPQSYFVVLGGDQDHFLRELNLCNRGVCLAGQLSLVESWGVIALSQALVTNDTGLLHLAELLNHPTLALMGPAPFGYPSKVGVSTWVLERDLPCRPCSKHGQGPCINSNFQACLRLIKPLEVKQVIHQILSGDQNSNSNFPGLPFPPH